MPFHQKDHPSKPSATPSPESTTSPESPRQRQEEQELPGTPVNLSPENERILKQALGLDPDDPTFSVSASIVDVPREAPPPELRDALMDFMDALARPLRRPGVTAAETPRARDVVPVIAKILPEIGGEAHFATAKHGHFKSAHEGYAVIKEELDELWDAIKDNDGYTSCARREAIQIAATALKYVILVDQRAEAAKQDGLKHESP